MTSQCKPGLRGFLSLEVETTTNGRRQHRRLLVDVLDRLWRFSRPTWRTSTRLVRPLLSSTTLLPRPRRRRLDLDAGSEMHRPLYSPPLPLALFFNLRRLHAVYAVAVQNLTVAEIHTQPSVFGSISAGQFTKIAIWRIFNFLIFSPSLTKLTKKLSLFFKIFK